VILVRLPLDAGGPWARPAVPAAVIEIDLGRGGNCSGQDEHDDSGGLKESPPSYQILVLG